MDTAIRCLAALAVLSATSSDLRGDENGPALHAQAEVQTEQTPARTRSDRFVVPPAPDEGDEAPPAADAGGDVSPARADGDEPGGVDPGQRPVDEPPAAGESQNYLGVFTDPVPPPLAAQFADLLGEGEGLVVTSVVPGAAADQAGLQVNDVLVRYESERLGSPEQLKRLVVADEPGATVELEIIRAARPQTVSVTLGQRALAPPAAHHAAGVTPAGPGPFPIGIHLPGPRSIIVDRYGLRSPWIAVDWGSPLAGRRFRALTPGGRQFEVEVRV
ncbi:MAG TPA: PDZ domain-containing protein, partial [Planctomycetaceae bacterium]|nr:PDZ domain-containing protein [Planctomycetaceae bacterium]